MKLLNCIIIDDEPLARKGLQTYCNDISFLNVVGVCKNALQANDILQQQKVDLLFLDINMPIVSGLDWLKSLTSSPLVVMTTAYPQYALESFSYEVIDYLVKPISFERFLQAVNKAYRLAKTTEDESVFFVKSDKSLKKIKLHEILFVEAMQNYVKIVTISETVITHSTLKQLRDNLPEQFFVQTHKSYLVSKAQVSEITGNQILIGEHKIPISVRLKKEVLQQILNS
ncbi:LytTR family DNA-binding domain-containing protein [uncultured Kordia sp.]|uniref:LytR/AlgR family response regulator transcription factor n=1 Tax=uncultured Kordia sp. TaxID=507699 RepID=UPI00260B573F|nr:LytTR family DNA-binding domain-containing protein [uncultured Kordia sp.]